MIRASLAGALLVTMVAALSQWTGLETAERTRGDRNAAATPATPGFRASPVPTTRDRKFPPGASRPLKTGGRPPGRGSSPARFKPAARSSSSPEPGSTNRSARHAISVHWEVLQSIRESGSGSLAVDTGPDSFTARVSHVMENPGGGYSLSGEISGDSPGTFLATVHGSALVAHIVTRSGIPRRFAITPSAPGLHELQELNPSGGMLCGGVLVPPQPALARTAQDRGHPGKPRKGRRPLRSSHFKDNHHTVIDIMIVYTTAARRDRGGTDGIIAAANQAINWTNIAFTRSQVDLSFRLAHTEEVSYPESGNSRTDLLRLQDASDSYLDEVHPLRDRYRADIVSLWTSTNYGGRSYETKSAQFAFNICGGSSSDYILETFAHECGHNMGCGHHRQQETPGPSDLFSYGAGWRWGGDANSRWRSIMSYEPGGITQHYSNPDVWHDGSPTGTATDNNARVLRETMSEVATHRAALGPPVISVAPGNYTFPHIGGSTRVTVASSDPYEWESDAPWLGSSEPDNKGDEDFFYTVAPNPMRAQRVATLTFVSRGAVTTHTVTQLGNPQADHGNTPATATLIAPTSTTSGAIGPDGDLDYFRLAITEPGLLTIRTTGNTDTIGTLYLGDPEDGSELASNDDWEGAQENDFNFRITLTLGPGHYYLKVMVFDREVTGSYQLVSLFENDFEDNEGNTAETAVPIEPDTVYSGNIDYENDVDVFEISLPGPGTLTARTTGETDTYGNLFTLSDGEVIQAPVDSAQQDISIGDANFRIVAQGGPGTYLVAVWHQDTTGTGPYQLRISFAPSTTLEVSSDTASLSATGGNGAFTVSSNTTWDWTSSAPWLTSNEATTQSDNQTFSYSLAANTSTQPRTATITITAGNLSRTHTVTQAGRPRTRSIGITLQTYLLQPGTLHRLDLGFTPRSGKSYLIEESLNLTDWEPLEAGITGNDLPIQRSYSFNPSTRTRWFLRVVEQ